MGACSCTSKFVIVVVNIFFFLGAALLIYSGVAYLNSADHVMGEVNEYKPAYFTFGVGGLLCLCGIIGICGAFSEKKVLLGIFAVVVFVTLALLIAASSLLFVHRDSAMNATDDFVIKQFNNYGNPNLTMGLYFDDDKNTPFTAAIEATTGFGSGTNTTAMETTTGSGFGTTHAGVASTTSDSSTTAAPMTTAAPKADTNATDFIDSIQKNLECCGWTNYTEWNEYDYWTKTMKMDGHVPASCCNITAAEAHNKTCSTTFVIKGNEALIYSNTCQDQVEKVVKFGYTFLSWMTVAFAILVFLGFVGSIFLMCRKRSSDGFNYSSIVA